VLHFHQDDYPNAAEFSRQAMAIWAAQGKPEHPFALISKSHLATALRESGDLVEGERIGREVLEARRRLAGDNHLAISISLDDLGVTLRLSGRGADALLLQSQARELRAGAGLSTSDSAVAQVQYALSESATGDQTGARADIEAALTVLTDGNAPNPMQVGDAQLAKAHIALTQHDIDAGCAAVRVALDMHPADDPLSGWRGAEAQSVHGECLAARKQFVAARRELQSALSTLQRVRGVDHWMTKQVSRSLQAIAKA